MLETEVHVMSDGSGTTLSCQETEQVCSTPATRRVRFVLDRATPPEVRAVEGFLQNMATRIGGFRHQCSMFSQSTEVLKATWPQVVVQRCFERVPHLVQSYTRERGGIHLGGRLPSECKCGTVRSLRYIAAAAQRNRQLGLRQAEQERRRNVMTRWLFVGSNWILWT